MTWNPIVSIEELAKHLEDRDWAVIDCRFDLSQPELGRLAYQESHVPGAVYADLEKDLSGPVTPGVTGRHPLPDVSALAARFSSWGIDSTTRVIAYDDSAGSMACRLWWLLSWLGHEYVAVLNGGWEAWTSAGQPTHPGTETRPDRIFVPHPHPEYLAQADEILNAIGKQGMVLVDSRAPERYRGESEPIDPVAGHIPGAVNLYHMDIVDMEGHLLPTSTLTERFRSLLGERDPSAAVFYCGSGVTAAHNLLAMAAAGLPGSRLYAGSWSEWITEPTRPIKIEPPKSKTDDH